MNQPSNQTIEHQGWVKPICRCDSTTLCKDCVTLVTTARNLCRVREYRYVKLLAHIFYAHRKIELARAHQNGHPTCFKAALQDMDYVTGGTQALSGVTDKGLPIWENRIISSKVYE